MGLEEFVTVVVCPSNGTPYDELDRVDEIREAYLSIARDFTAGNVDLFEIPFDIPPEKIAREVADRIANKKFLLISLRHSDIAYCHNNSDTALITFDRHIDSKGHKFSPRGFLDRRKGDVYVIGSNKQPKSPRIRVCSPYDVEIMLDVPNGIQREILKAPGSKFLLSLDVDVFDPEITNGFYRTPPALLERLVMASDRRGWTDWRPKVYLTPMEVIEFSRELVYNGELMGIHIAGYDPAKDLIEPEKPTQSVRLVPRNAVKIADRASIISQSHGLPLYNSKGESELKRYLDQIRQALSVIEQIKFYRN